MAPTISARFRSRHHTDPDCRMRWQKKRPSADTSTVCRPEVCSRSKWPGAVAEGGGAGKVLASMT